MDFENTICKLVAIVFRPQCDKLSGGDPILATANGLKYV